jgi:WD40 repeat protein
LPDEPVGKRHELPAFSPDSTLLALRSTNNQTVTLYNVATGQVNRELIGAAAKFLDFLADGKTLIAGDPKTGLKRWQVPGGGQSPAAFGGKLGGFTKAALSPDGSWLASAIGKGGSSAVRILDVKRDVLHEHIKAVGTVGALVFSRDGNILAWSEEADKGSIRVRLWDIAGNKELHGPPAYHGSTTLGFALHPQGSLLALAARPTRPAPAAPMKRRRSMGRVRCGNRPEDERKDDERKDDERKDMAAPSLTNAIGAGIGRNAIPFV